MIKNQVSCFFETQCMCHICWLVGVINDDDDGEGKGGRQFYESTPGMLLLH